MQEMELTGKDKENYNNTVLKIRRIAETRWSDFITSDNRDDPASVESVINNFNDDIVKGVEESSPVARDMLIKAARDEMAKLKREFERDPQAQRLRLTRLKDWEIPEFLVTIERFWLRWLRVNRLDPVKASEMMRKFNDDTAAVVCNHPEENAREFIDFVNQKLARLSVEYRTSAAAQHDRLAKAYPQLAADQQDVARPVAVKQGTVLQQILVDPATRARIKAMAETKWRAMMPAMARDPRAAEREIERWMHESIDTMVRTGTPESMAPEVAKILIYDIDLLINEWNVDVRGQMRRLGVSKATLTASSQPARSRHAGADLANYVVKTAVRATIWEVVRALFGR